MPPISPLPDVPPPLPPWALQVPPRAAEPPPLPPEAVQIPPCAAEPPPLPPEAVQIPPRAAEPPPLPPEAVQIPPRAAEPPPLPPEAVQGQVMPPIPDSHTTVAIKRVDVLVDPDEARVTAETIMGIAQRGNVYQRGGVIVEPRLIPAPLVKSDEARPTILRTTDSWQVTESSAPRVRSLAAESCRFTCYGKKGNLIETNVPAYLANAIRAASRWPFPPLTGLAEAPTMRPDGTLLTEYGYDARTGIYLASTVRVTVAEAPTLAEAKAAAEQLLDVVRDFSFSSPAGPSVWLSGVLSTAARPAIDGPVPAHLVDASMRGSGKTKLADAACIITTGRPASRMSYSSTDEEMDKRIISLALAGDATVLIDNVVGTLGCPSLDAALTSVSYRGRILGKSEMTPHMPMLIVWWVTGNGMIIGADLARRSILCRLEPQCEHPEERTGPTPGSTWRHPRLLNYVMEHRARLLSAALTIVRAYIVAGKPDMGLKPMDYEAWSDLIRSAIVWIGLADPAESIKDVRAADLRANAFRNVMEYWPVPVGSWITAGELLKLADHLIPGSPEFKSKKEQYEAWRAALVEWIPPKRGDELPTSYAVGCALRSAKGVIVGKNKIIAGEHSKLGTPWSKVCV